MYWGENYETQGKAQESKGMHIHTREWERRRKEDWVERASDSAKQALAKSMGKSSTKIIEEASCFR